MTQTIKITNLKNGTRNITGLTAGDMRLIAMFLERGVISSPKTDSNIPICDAAMRLADALRSNAMFDGRIGNIEMVGGTADASILYDELINL
jgi:hypothetical protein